MDFRGWQGCFRDVFGVLLLLLGLVSFASADTDGAIDWDSALYVSPEGNDAAAGTFQAPLATLAQALTRLPAHGGGVIALREGVYRQRLVLPAPAAGTALQPLILTAAPGERVIVEGGEPIRTWRPWGDQPGMFEIAAAEVQLAYATGAQWADVWELDQGVRYRRMLDADGVRTYPGSFCVLAGDRWLIHTRDGRTPAELTLWQNRLGEGLQIGRSQVRVQGLQFQHYLGGRQARAITVMRETQGVAIRDCTILNSVRGLSIAGDGTLVQGCQLREVGQGLVTYGQDTVVRDCVIEATVGDFAIADLNQHERDGLRFYHPARGGTVEGCVTVGFWAGLYIKTASGAADARPFLIRNNTFIDGIRAGAGGRQALSRYEYNLIGPNEEGVDIRRYLTEGLGASFAGNRFWGGGTVSGDDRLGPMPLVDLVGGDLTWATEEAVGAPPRRLAWGRAMTVALRQRALAENQPVPAAAFVGTPLVVSSQHGAVITVETTVALRPVLRYRQVGAQAWQSQRGVDATPDRRAVMPTSAAVVASPQALAHRTVFALTDGGLTPQSDYQAQIHATQPDGTRLVSPILTFRTTGAARELFVQPGAPELAADGSRQRPFGQLQPALDRALPGDTVMLAEGVLTEPAVLAHGGGAGLPITLQGAGMRRTILDGGHAVAILLDLRRSGHVAIRDMTLRWFGDSGLSVADSEHITVKRCLFINAPMAGGSVNGRGVVLQRSPRARIAHCLFTRLETGAWIHHSPQLALINNTAYANMYQGAWLGESARDSQVTGNAFTFTGNDAFRLTESDAQAFASLVLDGNNYAAVLPGAAAAEEPLRPAPHYGAIGSGKGVVRAVLGQGADRKTHRFDDLAAWVAFSGKDAQSIFADPQYTDPRELDFSLAAGSPNRLADGAVIGAVIGEHAPAETSRPGERSR